MMAFRKTATIRSIMGSVMDSSLTGRRWIHVARIAPLERPINIATESEFVLPEFDQESNKSFKIEVPTFSFSSSMELMAVPKKKVSKYKKGLRNGPRALKPIPVIIRCKSCGRVKLPHFYCCSGLRDSNGESKDS